MQCLTLLAATLALASLASAASVKLPEYFPTACPRTSADLGECIKKNVQSVVPLLAKGEKLFGMEPLEPISVAEVRVNVKREPFDFHALVRNTKVHGVSGIIVRGARASLSDENRFDLELDVTFPTMVIEGDFKMDGKLGNFPFSGKGPFRTNFTDIVATWHLIGEPLVKDGEKYIQIKRFIPDYTVGSMKVYAENLVDGAPELTRLAVELINLNQKNVVSAMVPFMESSLERVMRQYSNTVFLSVPVDDLFPSSA